MNYNCAGCGTPTNESAHVVRSILETCQARVCYACALEWMNEPRAKHAMLTLDLDPSTLKEAALMATRFMGIDGKLYQYKNGQWYTHEEYRGGKELWSWRGDLHPEEVTSRTLCYWCKKVHGFDACALFAS